MSDGGNAATIVLIEDDSVQSELIQLAAMEAGLRAAMHCVGDGREGLRRLRQWIDGSDAPAPKLVLLDIKLPGMNGIEILPALQADGNAIPFPIVMLTSSKIADDLIDSFSHGAVSYFVKPSGFAELIRLMDTIGRRWLDRA